MKAHLENQFDKLRLIPCVVQDDRRGTVLMLAYMNKEAYEKTVATGKMWFWSRTRNALWQKGETSGNTLELVSLWWDCDQDTLLAKVTPMGPACHTGAESCFYQQDHSVSIIKAKDREDACQESFNSGLCHQVSPENTGESDKEQRKAGHEIFNDLDKVIEKRWQEQPEGSYTVKMAKKGENALLKKLGEETVEVVMACQEKDEDKIIHEAADLIFHLVLAIKFFNVSPAQVLQQLNDRFSD